MKNPCTECLNKSLCDTYGGSCFEKRMYLWLRKVFCRHRDNEVVCWHWTHGQMTNEPRFLEIQVKCNRCGKYHFMYIRDPKMYDEFTTKYADKQWSDTCKPVL